MVPCRRMRLHAQCCRCFFLVGSFSLAVLAESRAATSAAPSLIAFVNAPSPPTPPSKLLDASSRRTSSRLRCPLSCIAGAGHATSNLPGYVFDVRSSSFPLDCLRHRRLLLPSLALSATTPGGDDDMGRSPPRPPSPLAAGVFLAVAASYWYLLVLGAAAAANNWPVPDFIPLAPGWPPSDADLAPALEDSAHFFYIRDLLDHFLGGESSSTTAAAAETPPPPLRLALFNVAEAWVFAFLPVLLTDDDETRRLPTPVVWFTWLGALGLTNAFLAPYLAAMELRPLLGAVDDGATVAPHTRGQRSAGERVLSVAVGGVAAAVVAYTIAQTLGVVLADGGAEQIEALRALVESDRTYLAFCVDLVLFAAFQAWLMRDVVAAKATGGGGGGSRDDGIYYVPLLGLFAWLFRPGA